MKRELSIYKQIYSKVGWVNMLYEQKRKREEFDPSIMGMLTDPNYFSRKDLYKTIADHGKYMTGIVMDFGCGIMPYKRLFPASQYVGVEIDIPGAKKRKKYCLL